MNYIIAHDILSGKGPTKCQLTVISEDIKFKVVKAKMNLGVMLSKFEQGKRVGKRLEQFQYFD